MRSRFVVLFVLALTEAGCTGKVRHETARLAPTGLALEDGVTVVLERFSSEVPSSPTTASEERGESTNVWTVESFENKEDQVADCVFDALRETHPLEA